MDEDAAGVKDEPSLFPRVLIAGISVAVVVLFAALIWMIYSQGEGGGEPILVEAPEGPTKIEPEDRGGMDVPHKDKLVFNRVSGERSDADEQLRPIAETPLERPDVPSLEARIEESAEPVASGVKEVVAAVSGDPDKDDGAKAAVAEMTADEPDVAEKDAEKDSAASKPSKEKASAGLPRDQWAIQVAAYRQKHYARTWMIKTKFEHKEVFGDLTSELVETKRDMATYYRVRFGSFPDRAAALAKCDEVKKLDLNCIVVAPE
ncbi:hypothetical protein JCM17844_24170 [Iodidimonas gelatinilytica]|uniref:SPOR domain-containing protein n=1 Tax=Iodidimonas gelatinilytica TaxID=1236966 RepID=A0A5A7N0T8_9PROT|nr:SPOR domain-containing protein [Iodidimonas gelatinilytica]GEQ98780.1 hypothetical protein JCM17844_24170 [Iodidimonas gelatinilytica]GER01315.1 hypothetical protein JCM17845_19380 [Iodidimonas gelatinilytica]